MVVVANDCFSKMLITHPVLLLSSRIGRNNTLMPLVWYSSVSTDPPMIGISLKPSNTSYHFIRESGDFLLGVPGGSMVKAIHFCGIHSGRDIDKISHLNLTTTRAKSVSPLLIGNCMANIECRVRNITQMGDRPFITGEVISITAGDYYFNNDWTGEDCLIYYLGGTKYRVGCETVDMSSVKPGYIPPDSIG